MMSAWGMIILGVVLLILGIALMNIPFGFEGEYALVILGWILIIIGVILIAVGILTKVRGHL